MNYIKIYDNLINIGKNRIFPKDTYYEKHHILPKCMGGGDEPENLVKLTAEEHYLAHQLLVKIYPQVSGLVYAALIMSTHPNGKRNNNKLYGWLRRKQAVVAREQMIEYHKNNVHPFFGKKHTDESKELMSIAIKHGFRENGIVSMVHQFTLEGKYIKTFESLTEAAESVNGNVSNIKYTADGKFQYAYGYRWSYNKEVNGDIQDRNYVGNRGKMWITDGVKSITINKEDIIPEGWYYGRTISEKQLKPIIVLKNSIQIGEFKSISECEQKSLELYGVKLISTNISRVLKGKSKQYKGYTFKNK